MWRRILETGIIDKAGVIASIVCAIHCMVTPILLSFLPIVGLHFLEHSFHTVYLPILLLPGALAIIPGLITHKKTSPTIFFLAGILLFFVGIEMHDVTNNIVEALTFIGSSILIVIAHKKNHTYCKSCIKCEC